MNKTFKETRFSKWLLGDWDKQIAHRKQSINDLESRTLMLQQNVRLQSQVLMQRIVIGVLIVIVLVLISQLVKTVFK